MSTDVDVALHGPIFDNAAWDIAVDHFMHDVTMDIADEGVRDVRVELSHVLRHPTGRYEASIRAREQPFNTAMVDGMGVIYGWWLEGLGSRNAPVTRFPGYWTFKRVTPELESKVGDLVQPALERFVAEVNA